MAINLLALEPHKVSRDLSGYITYLYGEPKVGKTTLVSHFPGALLLATEKGYNALPGVFVQDITRWSDLKEVIRELKKPEVKEKFQSVIIDTIDVAAGYCDKYICNQLGIETLGEGGWSVNGWARYKKELEDTFRTIVNLGYALVFISHDKDKEFTRKDGSKYNQTVPTLQTSANEIVKAMADIYMYAIIDEATQERKLILRSLDGTIDAGCRFKYVKPEIPLDYDALVQTINDAIDREAKEHDNKFVTDKAIVATTEKTYDYDALMEEFQKLVGDLMSTDANNAPKIQVIVSKYLGKNKKVVDTTPDQAEFIYLINTEIKEELMKK